MVKTKAVFVMIVLILTVGLAYGQISEADRVKHFNLDDSGLGIKGYDPVSYFKGGPQKGVKTFSYTYKGIPYQFATPENLEAFKAAPEKYEPQYGGWCAWAMLDGDKVDFHPERYKIVDGKLYLFYDGFWGNTLKKWNKKAEKESEADMIKSADEHWKKIIGQ